LSTQQVQFHASRLVVGDDRFDAEFKVDLLAIMSSKVTKQAKVVAAAAEPAPPPAAAGNAPGSSSSSSSSTAVAGSGVAQAPAATAVLEPAAAAQEPGAAHSQWQRSSALSCKVMLGMTLRLPHPLSIVPGPLLSTTASLIAKLVMQSLLPSFLELLAADYGRWASGSSRAAPVGSLVAAGREQLALQQQRQQPSS
jgi:hypothetical protein